ncbi:aquaporin, partial [Pseudomonas aeruginosa]
TQYSLSETAKSSYARLVTFPLRAVGGELLGSALLTTVVVGSGIAAQRLSTDTGLQLLENALVTALGLTVLILVFAPVSGAHFNPAVTLVE